MNLRAIPALLLFGGLVWPTVIHMPSYAQLKTKTQHESWQDRLSEKDVTCGNFACSKEHSEIVARFFNEHPLNRTFPICHKTIVQSSKCRPLIPFPPIAKAASVIGTVSVHVLVDEKGRVLYARVLSGHPLLWAAARKGACETQFKEYPHHKHQGVMHFRVEDYEYLGVPKKANEVQ